MKTFLQICLQFGNVISGNDLQACSQLIFFCSYLRQENDTVIIGSWGGKYETVTEDKILQNALANWMMYNNFTNSIWYCLNPESVTTNGILKNDWNTVDKDKLKLLSRVQPAPSIYRPKSGEQFCIKNNVYEDSGKDFGELIVDFLSRK
jgi:hypothetical protein